MAGFLTHGFPESGANALQRGSAKPRRCSRSAPAAPRFPDTTALRKMLQTDQLSVSGRELANGRVDILSSGLWYRDHVV